MENHQERVHSNEEKIESLTNEISNIEKRVNEIDSKFQDINDAFKNLDTKISQSSEIFSSLQNHYTDYFLKQDATTKSKFEIITDHFTTVESVQKASVLLKKELEEFKDYIYGSTELGKLGFKKEMELYLEEYKKTSDSIQKAWSESYQVLFSKIEGLLPGATATGLSKAYQDQKKNYKAPVILWSIIFSATVVVMMIIGIYVFSSTQLKDFSTTIQHIVSRLPFFIPAIWLAIFASKQQSQYKRLQEEYIYKETLAKSYEAYKREIDQLPVSDDKDNLQLELISSMVKMCGYNPSTTLENSSHNDKVPLLGNEMIQNLVSKPNKTS